MPVDVEAILQNFGLLSDKLSNCIDKSVKQILPYMTGDRAELDLGKVV